MADLGLQMKVRKIEFLVVRKPKAGYHLPYRLEINGQEVTSFRAIKYLKIMLDDRLSRSAHLEYLQKKARTIVSKLGAIARNTFGYSTHARI